MNETHPLAPADEHIEPAVGPYEGVHEPDSVMGGGPSGPVTTERRWSATTGQYEDVPVAEAAPTPPKQQYTVLRHDPVTNLPRGYKCGRCGLEGLGFGEPHVDSVGVVCEPHPAGEAIQVRAVGGSIVREEQAVPAGAGAGTPVLAEPHSAEFTAELAKLSPTDRAQVLEDLKARNRTAAEAESVDHRDQNTPATTGAQPDTPPRVDQAVQNPLAAPESTREQGGPVGAAHVGEPQRDTFVAGDAATHAPPPDQPLPTV